MVCKSTTIINSFTKFYKHNTGVTMSELPTLYEYYQNSGVTSGLTENGTRFQLNGKPFTIHSGTMHYFRVHPAYWRDRLRKFRAAGLNCVETYFAWNIHEPQQGFYEFGNSKTDFEEFCDFEKFLCIAKEEDLLVIARPGPYICAEWEFGGLPSWLLRIPDVKIRTSDEKFMICVRKFFRELLGILGKYQFTKLGPIIAFQIENEYGNVKEQNTVIDTKYLEELKEIYLDNNIVELLFTSDTPSNGNYGSLPDVLNTANFQTDPEKELDQLKAYQPNKPALVMEYWAGWFDHWSGKHQTRNNATFSDTLERILGYPASCNMYVFHGGTNWGFLNGGNFENDKSDNSNIKLDTTSYDYDAPLSENGDYTDKYYSVKRILEKFSEIKLKIPALPTLLDRISYDNLQVKSELSLNDLLGNLEGVQSKNLTYMENLPINNNSGQSYGYTIYRKTKIDLSKNSTITIKNHVRDTIIILINNQLISPILRTKDDLDSFGFWKCNNSNLKIPTDFKSATLDILVENFGRVNYGKLYQFNQNKGLTENQVVLDDIPIQDWEIFPLEFKSNWTKNLGNWKQVSGGNGPKLYRFVLETEELRDCYIDMTGWTKGIVIVNGFVLGRYLKFGPQLSLYLPAPFLKIGQNDVLVFEHYLSGNVLKFSKEPIYN